MAEEIGFENGRNSNFQGPVTLTLTLDPAIRHTVVHHSSTSTCISNFIEIEETFCGWTDGRTYVRTDIFPPSNIIRSTFGSRPKYNYYYYCRYYYYFGFCLTGLLFPGDHTTLGQDPKVIPKKNRCGLLVQYFLQAGCPFCRPTNSFKAIKG